MLAAEVQAVIEELRPDVVVTLDASDGHPDHVAMRDATLTAVDASAHRVATTYFVRLTRSSMTGGPTICVGPVGVTPTSR